MALEELLRRNDPAENGAPAQESRQDRESLIQQARRLGGLPDVPSDASEEAPIEHVVCADGYERLTPVQPYRTPEDYYRRLILKIIGIAAVVILAVLLLIALSRAGFRLLRLR